MGGQFVLRCAAPGDSGGTEEVASVHVIGLRLCRSSATEWFISELKHDDSFNYQAWMLADNTLGSLWY